MSRKGKIIAAPKIAGVLLCGTILAGVPVAVHAQDAAPAATPAPAAAPAPAETIRSIVVTGAQRLEPETILSYVQLRVGGTYTEAAADQALKDLYASELIANATVRNDGGNITIDVQENPIVNRIILEGNKRLKDEKITPEIKLSPRQIFTRSKVRADVARIVELYKRQGRFAAVVEPKSVALPQNRVDIVYEITEGPKSKVRQINIIGNEKFGDGELRGQMVTKQSRFFRLFSSATSYDPDRLAYDQQKLRQFYLTQGYADFRVVSAMAELTPDKKDFIITYVVEEGQRYKFGDVSVESQLRDFDGNQLAKGIQVKKGNWYDAKLVEDTVEGLTQTAGLFGYAFADVRPDYSRDKENLTMNVKFVLNEAPRVYVESINVNGNTLTQDKVVRREFRLAEGDAFNSLQVKRSTARINSLGFFQQNFEVEQAQGSAPDRVTLNANVQEQATGELQLSAGFSSQESFILSGSIRQRNFRGKGQTIGLSADYSSYSRAFTLSFAEPYLFDKNISMGVDIYRRDSNNDYYNNNNTTFSQATTGFQVRAGVPLTEKMSLIGRYTLNWDDVTLDKSTYYSTRLTPTPECDPLLAGRYLCDALGNRISSIIGASLVYDNLDNRNRPTRGEQIALNLDFAGLGGSERYIKFRANASKFWNLGSGWIFSVKGEAGYVKGLKDRGPGEDSVRLTDRFFLGDPQIRGFDIRGVGPRVVREFYAFDNAGVPTCADGTSHADCAGNGGFTYTTDPKNPVDDPLGGDMYYLVRHELEIPLGSGARELGLRPSIFLDAGAVFSVKKPILTDTGPNGAFFPVKDDDGNPLYTQIDTALLVNGVCTVTATSQVTNPNNPTPPPCIGSGPIANTALGSKSASFRETFVGDSAKPRISVGIGVNWNSPFGPFRVDFAKVLLKERGDDTKAFTFNVGTQF
ncbi:MAG: outer membrane protein assembly factor BamA [Candidatus Andeanibacterium colombiense]|uniref:Outer membrane protein assembly factor BamA n=1 Tax=Candidatus Andeanibacterium colombiense TaxID=3121345 RepID=A0AAJ5X8X8_9SPHN|nr:MAG: outer membrane protein assembly factor BamA [Sphingomonadaceae bacterium]